MPAINQQIVKGISGVFLYLLFLQGHAQCPPGPLGVGRFLDKPSGCATGAGLMIQFQPLYSQLDDNAEIHIDWGDGTAETVINVGSTGIQAGINYNTPQPHTYTEANTSGTCVLDITCWVVSSCYTVDETTVTAEIAVFNTDDFGDGGSDITIAPMLVEVCAGTSVDVNFDDVSPWNCTDAAAISTLNNRPRWTRWTHGVFTDITGTVLIDGNPVIFPFQEPIFDHVPSPVLNPIAPGNQSLTVTVPATATIGEEFHIRLENWNQCNPYEDAGGVPTGNAPVTQQAIIRIIAPPDPIVNTVVPGPYCVGEAVDFEFGGTPLPGYTYEWDFGDGSPVSTDQDPTHTYTSDNGGTPFDVTVSVTNNNANVFSCQVVTTPAFQVTVNAVPEPVVSVEDIVGNPMATSFCAAAGGQDIYFNLDGASSIPNPGNTDVTWNFYEKDDFGTINTSFLNPALPILRTMVDPGVYRVEVEAMDNLTNCGSTDLVDITIYDTPISTFTSPANVCEGDRSSFNNIADQVTSIPVVVNGDQVEFWDWDFSYDGVTFNQELRRTDGSDFDWYLDGAPVVGEVEPATSVAGSYRVALLVTTQTGICSDLFETTITVNTVPVPVISVEDASNAAHPTTFCKAVAGEFLYFDLDPSSVNPHPGNTDFTWNFYAVDDDATIASSVVNPVTPVQRFFNDPGIYRVELVVDDLTSGCSASTDVHITMYDLPTASFEATEVCEGERTRFSGIDNVVPVSVNGDVVEFWDWDFSYDGVTFNQELRRTDNSDFEWFLDGSDVAGETEPLVSVAGKYLAALRVTTQIGQCFQIFSLEIEVKKTPVATLSSSYMKPVCFGEEVVFTNESVQPDEISQAGPVNYQLLVTDLDNSDVDTVNFFGATLPYGFQNNGTSQKTYAVNLVANAFNSCSARADTIFIAVNPGFNSAFSDPYYDPLMPNCSPLTGAFEVSLATAQLDVDSYTWTIEGEDGVLDGFPLTVQKGPANFNTLAYTLTNSLRRNVLYRITLSAEKEGVCITDSQQIVRVDPVPSGTFTVSESLDSCLTKTVVLEADERGLVAYDWVVAASPDQMVEDDDLLTLIYSRPDPGQPDVSSTVTLQTTNSAGCVSSTEEASFEVENLNQPVVVDFLATPERLILPNVGVSIQNLTTGGENLQYLWDFGDGTESLVADPGVHTFPGAGSYTIQLEVTNGFCVESVEQTVVIDPTVPEVDFVPDRYSGCRPLTVQFNNTSQFADSTRFVWDFGDDQGFSTAVNPRYTYNEPGTYSVTLTGQNSIGNSDTETKEAIIEVFEVPIAAFDLRPGEVYLPDKPVFFSNLSQAYDSAFWAFGDGNLSTEESPVHYYAEKGEYSVTLIVKTDNGCADTLRRQSAVLAIEGGNVVVPNAFTPSTLGPGGGEGGTGSFNDMFLPRTQGVVDFRMLIYNKWGQLIFESTNVDWGWDGYYNGRMAPQDVYVYKLELTYINGQRQEKVGDVTLIR